MSVAPTCRHHLSEFRHALPPALLASRPLWVAYSGGLDSTVLLMSCVAAGLPVRAIHVNHHLQEAAEPMQQHCQQWCGQHGIALDILHTQVQCSGGDSLEARAREARYRTIAAHVSQSQCNQPALVLTGHHQDDQLETVLIALFRGSGLQGLAGMSSLSPWPVTGYPALSLGRPLLQLRRDDLAVEAEQNNWQWFDDPTNTDSSLRRNWIRQHALPDIRAHFPQIDASLLRLARQVAQMREEWAAESAQALAVLLLKDGGLSRSGWQGLPAAGQLRVLRYWLAQQDVRINEARTVQLRDQLLRPQGGVRSVAPDWSIQLKGDSMRIVKSAGAVVTQGAEGVASNVSTERGAGHSQ